MDRDLQLAKNLLEGRTCDNCRYKECEQGDVCYCVLHRQLDSNPYLGIEPIPEENTCPKWEEREKVAYGMYISTTKEINDALKKDIKKWYQRQ